MERPECKCSKNSALFFEERVKEVVATTMESFLTECNLLVICPDAAPYVATLTVAYMLKQMGRNTDPVNPDAGFLSLASYVRDNLVSANAQLDLWEAEIESMMETKQ